MTNQVKGALILGCALLSFSIMAVMVKIASAEVSTLETVFFRGVMGIPMLLLIAQKRKVSLLGVNRKLLIARGLSGTIAMGMFFYAIWKMPVANAILLNQTTPIFILPIAAIILKEKITLKHILLVAIALTGVSLVIKPNLNQVDIPSLVALGSACFAALAYVLVRKLTQTDKTLVIVFWFTTIITIVSGIPLIWDFQIPSLPILFALISIGVFGNIGQLLLTKAFSLGEASRLAILGSLGAVLGVFWDFILFNHAIDRWTALGGVIVMLSCATLQKSKLNKPTNPK